MLVTTGKNPVTTYRAIFEGAGLSWFFEVGNNEIGLPFSDAKVWFPWNVNDIESLAAVNLQQTLIVTTTLVLTGLAVAFAFRCGLFNIGGQGQYIVGSIWAVWIGSSFDGLNPFLHITLAIVVATLAGAAWAGIAGFLKATVGAHEVISTIMLNWIAIWVGSFLFGLGGPLQNDTQTSVPISNDIVEGAQPPDPLGRPAAAGPPHGDLLRDRRARRVLGGPQPDDARVRRPRGRLQPRGRALRRHQRPAQLLPGDGDLGRVRGDRGRDRRARVAVPPGDGRHPDQPARVHGHRGRAPRPEHRGGRLPVGPALRLARQRGRRRGTSTPTSSSPSSPSI